MSGPKKPRGAVAPKPAPAAPLTADQLRVAQLFATLTDQTQQAMLYMMVEMAKDFPRRARPALRLVSGGAQ